MSPPPNYPQQGGYPQGPQQQAYPQQGYPQQGYPQQGYPQPYGQGPKRNVALIVVGAILSLIGLLSSLVFVYNLNDYANAEDNFADLPDSGWVVDLVKEADLKRMMIFGVIAALFGLTGLVLGGLGLRKR